jgi:glutamyl-tRNA reductase
VLEVVSVATCNRSELYLLTLDSAAVLPLAVAAFARFAEADPEELSTMLAVREERGAVEHLMRVAAGVESVVIGEAQIQGQLKEALERAHKEKTCGPVLDRLFRGALEAGKRVRSTTRIGEGRASVGSVAAQLLEQRLGTLEGKNILILGAGSMGSLVATTLQEHGISSVRVANRDGARAARVAEQAGALPTTFENLEAELAWCDAVVSSTAAPHPVITKDVVARAMEQRDERPLVLVDLAVPRDVEASVADLPACHLFDLDDLEHVVAATLDMRSREVDAVHSIVRAASSEFAEWRRGQDAVPAILAMRSAAEQIRDEEFARYASRHDHLAPEDRRRVEQLTRSIVNRVLHGPTVHLRASAVTPVVSDDAGHADWTRAVQRMFGLDSSV